MMKVHDWLLGINIAITISDKEGKIVYMNEKSQETFAKHGGKDLIGRDLLDCHSERSQKIIAQLQQQEITNAYTIDKKGEKKLIYQTPWYEDGQVQGLVEFSLVLPPEMPNYVR